MNINNDKKIIKELEIALRYYIKGIVINCTSSNKWLETIQRMTEQSLLEYTMVDKKKKNFLELQNVKYKDNVISIIFDNEKCNYKEDKKQIRILIPCKSQSNKMYILEGYPKVIV